jgi:hypothetical protein
MFIWPKRFTVQLGNLTLLLCLYARVSPTSSLEKKSCLDVSALWLFTSTFCNGKKNTGRKTECTHEGSFSFIKSSLSVEGLRDPRFPWLFYLVHRAVPVCRLLEL